MASKDTIYFDYQATTPLDPEVRRALEPYLDGLYGNPHSADHSVGWAASEAVKRSAGVVGNLVGADADEIVFTSGATEANNLALLGLAPLKKKVGRDRVLVSSIEHKCVLEAARGLEYDHGYSLARIPVDAMGRVDMAELEREIDDRVLVVSVMLVNNEIGTIQRLEEISELAHKYGVIVHCDAAQAPCAMDISGIAEFADLVSLSSHKMYGPMGIGALYVRRGLQSQIYPLIRGGGQQNGLRSGTVPVFLCVGMAAAAELACGPGAPIERKSVGRLRDYFVSLLRGSGRDVVLIGPESTERHPGNANLRFPGYDAHGLLGAMQPWLAASTGSACASGSLEPSHVLDAIGLTRDAAGECIRFSLGRFTTKDDVEKASEIVLKALSDMVA